jgi:hypothetical protein
VYEEGEFSQSTPDIQTRILVGLPPKPNINFPIPASTLMLVLGSIGATHGTPPKFNRIAKLAARITPIPTATGLSTTMMILRIMGSSAI